MSPLNDDIIHGGYLLMAVKVASSIFVKLQVLGLRLQGVSKKMRHFVCLISLATNMLERWDP